MSQEIVGKILSVQKKEITSQLRIQAKACSNQINLTDLANQLTILNPQRKSESDQLQV